MGSLLNSEKFREIIWDTTEKDLNLYKRDIRPIRWFILFWVGIVYLWGCAQLLLGDYLRLPLGGFLFIIVSWKFPSWEPIPPPPPPGREPITRFNTITNHIYHPLNALYPSLNVICIVLMTTQFCLHWICLSGRSLN